MVYNEKLNIDIPEGWKVEIINKVCDVVDCLHSKKPDYCYENEFDDWEDAFRQINPDFIFFGYNKSMEYFKLRGFNGYWVPLSGDFEVFRPYEEKKTRMFISRSQQET